MSTTIWPFPFQPIGNLMVTPLRIQKKKDQKVHSINQLGWKEGNTHFHFMKIFIEKVTRQALSYWNLKFYDMLSFKMAWYARKWKEKKNYVASCEFFCCNWINYVEKWKRKENCFRLEVSFLNWFGLVSSVIFVKTKSNQTVKL